MGAPELWRILVSIVGAGIALGAVFVVLRLFRWDSRLPERWVPPIITGFMMLASVGLLVALARPPSPVAAVTPAAVEEPGQEVSPSTWTIRVYPFESWGTAARRKDLGPDLARRIMLLLRDEGLWARKGLEELPPVGLHDIKGERPTNLIDHYSKLAPFLCVSGYVSVKKDGRFEATVTVSWVDKAARSSTILERTLTFSDSDETIDLAARSLVAEFLEIAEAGIEAP